MQSSVVDRHRFDADMLLVQLLSPRLSSQLSYHYHGLPHSSATFATAVLMAQLLLLLFRYYQFCTAVLTVQLLSPRLSSQFSYCIITTVILTVQLLLPRQSSRLGYYYPHSFAPHGYTHSLVIITTASFTVQLLYYVLILSPRLYSYNSAIITTVVLTL